MFDRNIFPRVLVVLFSFLIVKCMAERQTITYIQKDYWANNTSLQCYDCNSKNDPRCGDPFDPYTIGIVNCSALKVPEHLRNTEEHPNESIKPTVCRKIVQIVESETRVIRECGYIQDQRDDKECSRRTGTKNIQVFYCACTHSLCNEGSSIRPLYFNLGIVLLFSLVGRVFKF